MGLFGNSILMVSEDNQINTIAAFENRAYEVLVVIDAAET